MSDSVTNPTDKKVDAAAPGGNASPSGKGKSKAVDQPMDEGDDEEDDEDDEEMGSDEEDEEEEEEGFEEIDPTAIVGRRTRGVRVDYTSKEALEKAGLQGHEDDDDEDEEMKD